MGKDARRGLRAARRALSRSTAPRARFLRDCTKAGLDLAIANSEKIQRYASIPEHERVLAENLLMNRGEDPVAAIAAHSTFSAPRTSACA